MIFKINGAFYEYQPIGEAMKIRIREIETGCMPEKIVQGDWIDLRAADDIRFKKGQYGIIPLGIAVEIPEGYEAHIVPRSSTFIKTGLMMANSFGVIDNSYCGDNDEWGFPYYATATGGVNKGQRIAQFRIVKNQPDLDLVKVETLGNENRGGFGSTGE